MRLLLSVNFGESVKALEIDVLDRNAIGNYCSKCLKQWLLFGLLCYTGDV